MIVVDASAAVLGLLHDGEARALLARESIVCPHLADSEVLHALRAQVRRGSIDVGAAQTAIAAWARLGLRRLGVSGLLDRMWDLRDNLSGYDASYVAIAEAIDAPLVTADGRLARAPGPRCSIMVIRG